MKTIAYCTSMTGFTAEEQTRRREIIEGWLPDDIKVEMIVVSGGSVSIDKGPDLRVPDKSGASFLTSVDPRRHDIIISAGAIDPGLATLRASSPVPVIGPGEVAMFVASILAVPVSILALDERAVERAKAMVEQLAIKPSIASIRSIEMPSGQMDLPSVRNATMREARRAVREDGARAIYFGAMTLGTLGIDEALRHELKVTVINPIQVALATAVQCLRAVA